MYGYTSYYPWCDYRQAAFSCEWTPSRVELNRTLRALWEQHVYWTRLTVNSIVGKLPDQKETIARLLRNPIDFANALAPLYGQPIAQQFANLLTGHLTIAAELVTDLRDNNMEAAKDAQRRWYANAEELAQFLGSINPYWSKDDWQHMLFEHLNLLTEEVAARLAGDYAKNVALSDQIEPQALEMADEMTTGIIRQFPMNFQN